MASYISRILTAPATAVPAKPAVCTWCDADVLKPAKDWDYTCPECGNPA